MDLAEARGYPPNMFDGSVTFDPNETHSKMLREIGIKRYLFMGIFMVIFMRISLMACTDILRTRILILRAFQGMVFYSHDSRGEPQHFPVDLYQCLLAMGDEWGCVSTGRKKHAQEYPCNIPYGGFLKWGYPQIIHFNGIFHY